MSDLEKALEIYNKRVAENPKYPQEVIDEWREDMPDQFIDYILPYPANFCNRSGTNRQ